MFPYDPILLAAVSTQPNRVADVISTMKHIASTCIDGDGLKWFNWLYLQVTEAVAARIVAGGFSDDAWLADLDVQFARLYFKALQLALSGQRPPGCWQALFERRDETPVSRIQFALAGINAHINHDLPLAIVATCEATGTAPLHGGTQYNDYTALNTTLDSLIEADKQALNVRLLGDVLPSFSAIEDTVAAWNVSAAREAAWNNAGLLWHLRAEPVLSSNFMDTLDGLTTVASKTLLVPVPQVAV